MALAGTVRGVPIPTASGQVLDHARQAAGCASQPGEVVNCTANDDNQTLHDLLALQLPLATPPRRAPACSTWPTPWWP